MLDAFKYDAKATKTFVFVVFSISPLPWESCKQTRGRICNYLFKLNHQLKETKLHWKFSALIIKQYLCPAAITIDQKAFF